VSEPSTIQDALAAFLRRHREEESGMTQAQYAAWLGERGVPWSRATIGAVEARRRDLSIDEVLWLQFCVKKPLDQMLEEGRGLLPRRTLVYLAGIDVRPAWYQLEDLARYGQPGAKPIAAGPFPRRLDAEYDRRLAEAVTRLLRAEDRRRRAITADEVETLAHELWHAPAAIERDARLSRLRPPQLSNTKAAIGHRAHISRAMAGELAEHLRQKRMAK
jgi:hypothetical protein